MSDAAYELALYLEDLGLGVFGGNTEWSLHTQREPVAPANVVTLYNTGGPEPVLIDEELRSPTLQVRARGTDSAATGERLDAIWRTLSAVVELDIGDHRYVGVYPSSDILDVGQDENDRYIKTANFAVIRHPTEEAS